jgi:hypothetical protein
MAKRRELALGNALSIFACVANVQVLINLTAFVLTINDLKGEFQAFAVARLQGLNIRLNNVSQINARRQWA